MKGWHGDRFKHRLASKGIKTNCGIINMSQNQKEVIDIIYDARVEDVLPESVIYQYVQILHKNHDDFVDGDLGDRIEEFKQYRLEKIKLNNLEDEWDMDYGLVNYYKQQYLDSETKIYPPIVLKRYKGGHYSIIDGTHRVEALKNIGNKKWVLAWVGVN